MEIKTTVQKVPMDICTLKLTLISAAESRGTELTTTFTRVVLEEKRATTHNTVYLSLHRAFSFPVAPPLVKIAPPICVQSFSLPLLKRHLVSHHLKDFIYNGL